MNKSITQLTKNSDASIQYEAKSMGIRIHPNRLRMSMMYFLLLSVMLFSGVRGLGQNAIVGDGFSTGWGGSCSSTGTGGFKYLAAGTGTTYILTTVASGTGDRFWRYGIDWSGTTNHWTITSGSDVTVTPNTKYSLTRSCTTSGSLKYNAPNITDNYIFKTLDAGTNPTGTVVFFRVQGAVRTVSTVAASPSSNITSADDVTITATLSGAFSTGQGAYLRYTNDGFATSTVVQMTGSGTSYSATIPKAVNISGKTVSYYVFTSGDSGPASNGSDADLYTINLNNNGGSNYSYTVLNDFRSRNTSGTWSTATDWETYNGTSWVTAGAAPTSSSGVITIQNGHTMTINSNVTVDQVVIDAGGQLSNNATLTLANGLSTDLTINGTFKALTSHALTINSGATIVVGNGGVYEHNRSFTNGLPAAASTTWSDGSTCLITSDITSFTTIASQNFFDLTINYSTGTSTRAFNTSMPSAIRNKLKIVATGSTGSITIGDGATAAALSITKLEVSGGLFYVGTGSGAHTLTCSDSLIVNGGTFRIAFASNNAQTYTATAKDVVVSSGILDLNGFNSASTNAGRLIFSGNLTVSGGTFTNSPGINSGSAGVYFNASGTAQSVTHSGGTLSTATGGVGRRFYYKTSSGPSALNETYSASSAQTTINGSEGTAASGYAAWPTTGSLINNVTVNNSAGVTLSTSKVINGVLTLTSGKLAIDANTLTLAGTVASMSGTNSLTGSASSNLTITGTGSLGTLFFDQGTPGTTNNIATLTLNRTSSGTVSLGNDATIGTSLTLTAGLLNLGSANLLIGGSASIGGSPSASNMVVATGAGQLRKTYGGTGSFTFPVGDNNGTAEYSPVTLNFTSGSFSSAYAGVNLVNSKYGSNSSATDFINRYWTVTTSGITSPVCTATFTYADGDIAGTEANLFGGRYLSGAWNCMDAVNTGSNQISKTGITAFGDFTAGEGTSMNCISCANPTNGGTIAAAQTICNGATPAAFTSSALPTGHTGTLEYKWMSSTTGSGSGFSDIGGATSTTYAPGALTVTTWFKRLSKVTCSGSWDLVAESNVLQVTVQSVPTAGTIGNAQTICTGGDPAAFTSTAAGTGDGTISYRWESAVSPFSSWSTIGGATSATYDPPTNLTATTQYRRYTVSTLNSVACESTSPTSAVQVTVNANLSAVTLSGTNNQTICSGATGSSLSVAETGGGTITGRQWGYRTTSGGSITSISGQTGTSYTPAAADLGGTGVRYIVCTSTPTCGSPTVSNEITITVNATLSAVSLTPSGAQTVCISGSGTQLTASETGGGTITARQWGYRTTSGGSITNISGQTGSTYTPSGADLGGTGVRYVVCTSTPTCGTATVSNEVTVTVVSAGTWIGGATGNWNTGSNWCGGVPTSTTDVVIPSGVTVTVDGAASAKTVTNGGTLQGSSNTLTISGNFVNNGTFTAGTGTISFNASATVSGTSTTTFNNVTLSAAVNFGAALSTINGTLQINSGGSVSTNSPAYGGSSTLNYNQTGSITQGLEWPSGSPQNVTVTNGTTVLLANDRSLAGNLTITNGVFRSSGARTLTMNGTTQSITISNTSGGAISGTDMGAGNDLTLTVSSGTTTLTGDASTTNDEDHKFFNINVNTGATLALSRGILCKYGTFTVSGTLQINSNGYVQSTSGASPTYGSSSTLVYNNGAGGFTASHEWTGNSTTAGAGIPQNVTIQNSTPVSMPNSNRGLAGTLTIGTGSTLTLNGTSGDLYVGGSWSNSGTFTPNNRAVYFNGSGTQTITKSGGETFDWFIVNKTSGSLELGSNVTINASKDVNFTNGSITLGNFNFTLGSGTTITNSTSSKYFITNGTGYLIRNVSSSEVTFPVGPTAAIYAPAYLTQAGTAENLSVRVAQAPFTNAPAGLSTAAVQLQWTLNEQTAGSNTITTKFQWNTTEEGADFNRSGTVQTGRFVSGSYTTSAATVAGSNPYTATSTGMTSTISAVPFVVGNDNCFTSIPVQYRSRQTGNWNDFNTWERSTNSGASWSNATSGQTPTSADGSVTIQNSHTVSVTGSVTVDQVTVNSGGILNLSGAVTLTINDGSGTDLDVSGTFIQSAGTLTNNGQIVVQNGGILRQAKVGTVIPTATWNSGSTCEVTGWTISNPGGYNQSFSNFTWNCTGQTVNFELEPTTMSVSGLFKVMSTGGSTDVLVLGNGSSARSLTVGSFEITGGNFYVTGNSASANNTLTITNNFTQSGGFFEVGRNNTNTGTCTVGGTFTTSGGTTRIMNNSGTGGIISTLTVTGATTINGGTLDLSASGSTNAGRLFVKGDLTVSSGSLIFTQALTGTNGSSGVYFDGTSTQTFTHSGGTISTASGGVGRRFYFKTTAGPTINEVYSASTAQTTVDGTDGTPASGYSRWPTSGTTLNNFTVNNAAGVTLSTARVVNGTLTLTSGILTTTSSNLMTVANTAAGAISGGSGTAYVSGPLARNLPASLGSGSTYVFPVGKSGSGYYPMTLNNPTTSTGTILLTAEAFAANAGGTGGTGIYSISTTEYWRLQSTGNFTNSGYSLTRPTAVTPFSAIGRSTTLAGAYASIGGTASSNSIVNSSTASGAADQYFAFGTVPAISFTGTPLSSFGNVCINTTSSELSFTAIGSYLKGNLTLTPPVGFEISTTSGSGFVANPSTLSLSPSSGSVSQTIYVRFNPTLVQAYSDNIAASSTDATSQNVAVAGTGITVPGQPGTITGSTSVCANTGSYTYSISAVSGATSYTWSVPSGWAINSGQNSTSITVTSGGLGTDGNISVTADNSCGSSTTRTLGVTVIASVGGTATATASTVCLNGSTSITLTGHSGNIQWQRSENGGTTWSNITGATSATYNTPNLIVTTSYRAVVTNGSCSSANSTTATVSLSAETNQSTAAATVFNTWDNNDDDAITGLGAWTLSGTGGGGFFVGSSDANNADTRSWGLFAGGTGGGNQANAYRTVLLNIGNTVSFSMDNSSVTSGNSVGFGLQNASGQNLMELYFTGGGSFYTLNDGTGTTTTTVAYTTGGLDIALTYTGLNTYSINITPKSGATVSYTGRSFSTQGGGQIPDRLRFFNAGAGSGSNYDLFFNTLSINRPVLTAQPSTSTQTLCQGASATALTVTANGTVSTYQWYRTSSNTSYTSPTPTAVGTNANSYTPLTSSSEVGTNYYFCVVTGACGTVYSKFSGGVTVSATSAGGTASSDQTICSGTEPANITLSGQTGTIQWQKASDASFTSPTNIGTNSTTLTGAEVGTLTATTYIRAVVTNSPCTAANSNTVTITITGSTGGGVTASSSSTCLGGSVTLTGTGNNGTSFQWQRSTDLSVWEDISGATTNPYTTTPNTVTTYYRLTVTNGSCAPDNSTYATINILDVNNSTAGSSTYNGGWSNGQNDNITGLGAWTLTTSGTAGFFTQGSQDNDNGTSGLPNINTSSRAWGMYANSGGLASAVRTITGNLSVGQSMSFHIDNGSVATSSVVGFNLRNSSNNTLMELRFTGGGTAYTLDDNSTTTTSINFTRGGLEVYIIRTGTATYDIKILRKEDGVVDTYTGRTFKNPSGGQVPSEVRFFNNNAGSGSASDYYVNNLSISNPVITTQPSTSTQSVCLNGTPTNLTVAASGTGLSYQWYSNTSNSNTGGTNLGSGNGAQTATFTPLTNATGSLYYYCIVTGTCGTATSNVSGLVTVNALPTITTSGTANAQCYSATQQTTSLVYTATTQTPTSYSIDWTGMTDQGTTTFSFNAGGGTITGIVIPAGTAAGTYTGTLTITNAAGCSGTQAISVTVNPLPTLTTASNPAPAVTVCYSPTSQQTTLNYTATTQLTTGSPTYTIDWDNTANTAGLADQSTPTIQSFNAGSGSISGINISAGLPAGTYNGTMTITNTNGCIVTKSITLSITAAPTITTSGTLAAVCSSTGSQTTTLAFSATTNNPDAYSIDWDATANAANLNDQGNTSFNFAGGSPITNIAVSANVAPGTYSGTMTIYNGTCTSTQAVSLVVNSLPTITTGGTIDAVCYSAGSQTSSLTYSATTNSPTSYSINWDATANTAGLSDQSSTAFTFAGGGGTLNTIAITAGTPAGTYNGVMTLVNANGCSTTQNVSITINASPTVTTSGTIDAVCYSAGSQTASLTYTASSQSPTSYSINWDATANTAGLSDQSSTAFTFAGGGGTLNTIAITAGTPAGTYNGVMTIVNANGCSNTINVSVQVKAPPTTAAAGPDQLGGSSCGASSITLAANTPTVGTGTWTVTVGSGGSFADANDPTTTFTGTPGVTYTLRWTISNSPCTASYDEVDVLIGESPTTAAAGPDQLGASTCGLTTVTLAANTPVIGTGAWSVVSGTGGSFGNATSPTSTFTGTAGATYTLRWTITNGPCSSTDEVDVKFNQNPTTANAGTDQLPDCGTNSTTLAANNPTVGTGTWSIISGTGGTLTDASLYNTTFTGTIGTSYTLRWTITNAPCTASSDDVIVTFTPGNVGTYYSKAGQTDPNNKNNWTSNSDGTGTNPCGFTAGSTFIVQAGHSYTTTAAWNNSGTVDVYGTLTYNHESDVYTLSIRNGGLVTANEQNTIPTDGYFNIYNGGKYILNHDTYDNTTLTFGGTENFETNSTFEYQNDNDWQGGFATGISYGNLVYNMNLSRYFQEGDVIEIKGNLEMKQGTFDMRKGRVIGGNLIQTGGTIYLHGTTVNGNYSQEGSSSVAVVSNHTDSTTLFTVKGNYELKDGNFYLNNAGSQAIATSSRLRVEGNYTLSGGTFNFPTASNTAVAGIVLLQKDCNLQAGSAFGGFLSTSTNNAGIYFEGTGTQTLTTAFAHSAGFGRDAFYYKETGGPTALHEVYNGSTAQNTVNGTFASISSPLSGFKPWPGTFGNSTGSGNTLLQNLTINNAAGVTMRDKRIVNDSLKILNGVLTFNHADTLQIATGQDIFRTGGSLSIVPKFGTTVNVSYGEHTSGIITGNELPTVTTVLNDLTVYTKNDGVTLGAGPTVNGTLKIVADGKLDISASNNYPINMGSGGTFQNNGTFMQRTGTVTFLGNGTVNGSTATTFYNVKLGDGITNGGGVSFGSPIALIDSTLTVHKGGYVSANPPAYSANSRLLYHIGDNTVYGRNLEWSATSGTTGVTGGYPNDVQITNNTLLNYPNTGGAFSTDLSIGRDLIVDQNSALYMDYGAGTASGSLTVARDVTINGMLSLGDENAAGGDLYIGRNYTMGAGATPGGNGYPDYNGQMVSFNGSGANTVQTVTKTGGGTAYFDLLEVNNTATNGKVLLNTGTDLWIEGPNPGNSSYRQLRLVNGDLDLGAQRFVLHGVSPNSNNVLVDNGTRRILGSPGSSISIEGTATDGTPNLNVIPDNTSTDYLNIDGDATLETEVGVKLTNTIINGIFKINRYGFVTGTTNVTGDAPIYGNASTLIYNNGGPGFDRNFEWTAGTGSTIGVTPGYPNDIIVQNNTLLSIGSTAGYVTSGIADRALAGTLRIESGSTVTMNAMPNKLIVGDSMHIKGTLTLSTVAGGDAHVFGHWIRETSTTFTPNERWVRFMGGTTQKISTTALGGEIFYKLGINKNGSNDQVNLDQDVTVNDTCAIETGRLNINTDVITFNYLVSKGTNGSLISEETGTAIYNQNVTKGASQNVINANYGHLTLQNTSAKTFDNNPGISGDFTVINSGRITTPADMRFNGSNGPVQLISGLVEPTHGNFRSIDFSGVDNKRFVSEAAIMGHMTFSTSGGELRTIDLDGDDGGGGSTHNFTIISNADSTARVGNTNGWTVNGEAVVERYIPAARTWRFLSFPINSSSTSIRQYWTRSKQGTFPDPICYGAGFPYQGYTFDPQPVGSGTLITGHSFSSCDAALANQFDHVVTGGWSSIRYYNRNASNPWASVTSTPAIHIPPSQAGYLMFVRGDRTVNHIGSGVTTLRPKGPIKQKNITFNITGAITTDSFHVISNPYPGQIHLARVYKEDNNFNKIRNGFWIWDPHLNSDSGGYRTLSWTGVDDNYTITPCPGCDQSTKNLYAILNSAQAVIVKQRGSGGSLVVKENYKVSRTDNPQLFRFSNNAMGSLQVNVYKNTARGSELVDGTLCRFSDFYGNAQAEEYDASKLENFGENISFQSNRNQRLSVHSRVYPKRDDTLHLAFWKAAQRTYRLHISTENMTAVNLKAYLLDAFTGSETPIPLDGGDMSYEFQVNGDTKSQSQTRFKIVFQPGTAPEVHFTKVKAEPSGTANRVNWEVQSEINIRSYELERSNNGRDFSTITQKESGNNSSYAGYEWMDAEPFATLNYYRVKALDASGNFRYSNTVLVDRTTKKPEVRVYPTTVTNKTITVDVVAASSGNWGLSITNALGQVVFARNLIHGGGQSTQAVDLSKAQMVPGVYFLNIRNGQELLHTTKIIIQ